MTPSLTWPVMRAARLIQNGQTLAYPTETIWGLGCDPWQCDAVLQLLKLKRRDWRKGLILLSHHWDPFDCLLLQLPLEVQARVREKNHQPTTWLLPHQGQIPDWITGKQKSVAVRVSHHKVVRALCAHVGIITSTSANRSGLSPARTRLHITKQFGADFPTLAGTVGSEGKPSRILDAMSLEHIR